jgi:hypothetical protein
MMRGVIWQKFTHASEVFTTFIIMVMSALMMEAISTYETSVNFSHPRRKTFST